jgi:hypothetical protein
MYTRPMFLAAALGATLMAVQPVTVESDACPSSQEVVRALVPLLPSLPAGAAPDLARVVQRATSLHIELHSPDGVAIAERDLESTGSCAELAQIVAVVIAAWESDVHPAFAKPMTEATSSPEPIIDATPATVRRSSYDLAAGGGVSISESTVAGVALAFAWAPHGTGFALRFGGMGESQHDVSLGQGQAQWRRWIGSTEVGWRIGLGASVVDLHGGLLFGFLTASGNGFSPNSQASSFSPGLTVGARWAVWPGRVVGLWLGVAGLGFQRSQALVVSPPSQSQQEVPHFQGLVTLGLAAGRPPSEIDVPR